ncbi:MAG: C-terminal binding protein [Peptostreptococcaceae bacterium]|nr:C-terminal binding protein [Peptostreptococcaceae bacterium]
MRVYQITTDANPKMVQKNLPREIQFYYRPCKSEEEIIERCTDAHCLVSIYEPITKKVMDFLENLEYICVASIGFDNVDTEYAKYKGIYVSNSPFYCIAEVADHTVGLVLNLVRKIHLFNEYVKKEQLWDYNRYGNTLERMSKQIIGLIGFGSIAREVAKRFRGFGCRIIAYDPFLKEEDFKKEGVEKVSLSVIQENANIISLHLPLNENTKGLVDTDFIAQLKQSPILINCSRGQLIEREAVEKAIKDGSISGLGIDVLEDEYPDLKEIEFLYQEQVLVTPHVAFYSKTSVEEADLSVGRYIQYYVSGELDKIPMVWR